ncbi:sigma-70 family RNA polymerase sigma factor [Actinophytocola sediminis]
MTIRSCGHSRDDAEDVWQLVWMRVFQKIHLVRDPSKVRAWIITVARREALRHQETLARVRPSVDITDVGGAVDSDASPEEHALDVAEAEALHRIVTSLPADQRALLYLLFGDQTLSYAEISNRLRIPRGSIGPTRQRILRHLREQFTRPGLPRQLDHRAEPHTTRSSGHDRAHRGFPRELAGRAAR